MTDLPEIITRFVGDARPLIAATAEARAAIKAYAEDAKRYSAEQAATVRRAQQSQADDVKRYQAEQAAALKRYQAEQKAALQASDSEKAAELARYREEEKAATARFNAEQLAATRRYTAEQNALIRARYAEQRAMQLKAAEESNAQRALTKVVGGSPVGTAVGGEAFLGMGAAGVAIGSVAVAAAGMAAVSAESLKMAGNFEQATTRLVTSAGEDRKNLDLVRKGLLDMSAQVGYSAQDLAAGMYMVESAGFHGADGLKVERAAAEGAKAENADLAVVSNAVTTALLDYGLGADHAADMTSKLVATTSVGKTTFEGLTESLHSVLPVAGQLHVPLDDILGSLAAMTVHGMSADQASQNLTDVLRHMERPTSIQAKELAMLGMTTAQFADDLKSKGLAGTLQLISDKMAKLMPPGSDKVILDVTNAVKGLDPQVQDLASHVFDGTMSMKDYNDAAKGLPPILAKQAQQFATLVGSTHRIGDAQMTGAQVMQTYGQFWQQLTGDATGLNVAMMLTGQNAPIVTNAIKTIGGATADASGHVKGWSDIQQTLNQQIAEFKAAVEALGIKLGDWLMPKVKDLIGLAKDFGHGLKDIFKDDHTFDDFGAKLDKLWKETLPELKKSADYVLKAIRDNKDGLEKLGKFIGDDLIPLLAITLPVSLKILTALVGGTITVWGMLGQAISAFKEAAIFALKAFVNMALDGFGAVLHGVDRLVDAIPGVPKSWKTGLDNAAKNFDQFRDHILGDLDSLDGKTANVYIHGHVDGTNLIQHGSTFSAIGKPAKFAAEGGPIAAGQPYVVGELGPELIVPNVGAHVFTAAQTRQILSGRSGNTFSMSRGGGSTGAGASGSSAGSQPIVIHNVIELDGRKVYEGIIPHAQRHKGRNPTTALV